MKTEREAQAHDSTKKQEKQAGTAYWDKKKVDVMGQSRTALCMGLQKEKMWEGAGIVVHLWHMTK